MLFNNIITQKHSMAILYLRIPPSVYMTTKCCVPILFI